MYDRKKVPKFPVIYSKLVKTLQNGFLNGLLEIYGIFIDSIEKTPCRMTFKSYCIITDKKKVKQFTVTMKCL